ncbi:hypothetical protein AcV5_005424 [Taiwanofungus camphoratus]|nr:hypothetical protein AcV5_005424 [Antrodia cinnamomea]KAI0929602.1 hypothetical protein AcV7_005091 [Antrodia cinnamomea]
MALSPHSAIAKLQTLTRSDFWFTDGNIILMVGHAAFKVHRGQLERHSDIFRDLFAIPQPPGEERIDGCFWVELYDSPSDFLHLLGALYDGLYFEKSSASDFAAVAAVLRLSTKYFIEHLRDRCLVRLKADWPTTLVGWDDREKQATDSIGRYTPRETFAHPILAIELARELKLDDILASAFYDLSRYGPRKIVSGTIAPPLVLPLPALLPSASCKASAEEHAVICLSQQDLYITLLGREAGQRYMATFIDKEIANRPISSDCTNKLKEDGRVCRESFYFIMLNVLRSVGGIACGRDADPLFTLMQAIDMLSRTDFSDGVKQCGLQMCASCKDDFADSVSKAREDVWERMPAWFGLKVSPSAGS